MLLFLQTDNWTFLTWLGSLAGAIILVGAAFKAISEIRRHGWEVFRDKWIRPFKARRRTERERQAAAFDKIESLIGNVTDLTATCGGMGEKISEIYREVKPNGGASLKDQVTGISSKLDNIDARVRHQDETSEVPTFHMDAEGMMVFANSSFRELVNADESQLHHNTYISLMQEDDQIRFIRQLKQAIEMKMPIDIIVKFKLVGPHRRTVRLQASPDVRHGSVLKGFFGTAGEVIADA